MEPQNATITVPLPMMKAVQAYMLDKGVSFEDAVQKIINRQAYNYKDPTAPPPATIDNTETAAKLLIDCLEPEHKNLIYALAKETNRPLAAYVMSPLLLAREQGRVGVVVGNWSDMKASAVQQPMPNSQICEYCGQSFEPKRPGQRFCPPLPDDSDSCGRKYHVEKQRENLSHRPPSMLSQV